MLKGKSERERVGEGERDLYLLIRFPRDPSGWGTGRTKPSVYNSIRISHLSGRNPEYHHYLLGHISKELYQKQSAWDFNWHFKWDIDKTK